MYEEKLSLNKHYNIKQVVVWITLILLISAVTMKILGLHPKFNLAASLILGIFSLLSFFQKKANNTNDNLLFAALIVGDAAYLISLFFLIGRNFISLYK